MKENKKIMMPLIFAILTLIALVSGATFAYYTVETQNNYKTIKANVSASEVGSVAISSGPSLSLELTRPLLMKFETDKTYFATSNGAPVEEQNDKQVIATAQVTGPGTFTCNYTLNVAMTGDLYEAFQSRENKSTGELILTINDTDYDFNSETDITNLNIEGSLEVSEGTPQYIKAQFKFINKTDVEQDDLADKNVTFTFSLPTFNCEAK